MIFVSCPLLQHLEIALYAIEHGLHVLVTKPPVKTVADHLKLIEAAKRFSYFILFRFIASKIYMIRRKQVLESL